MSSKPSLASGHQGQHAEARRTAGAVCFATSWPIRSSASRLPFGRFLLSSVGLHLLVVWAVIGIGLTRLPRLEQPLVVALVQAGDPGPSGAAAQPVRARARQQAAPGQPPHAAVPQPIVQPRIASSPPLPPPGYPPGAEGTRGEGKEGGARPSPASGAPREVEVIEQTALDDRREMASFHVTEETVRDPGLPVAASIPSEGGPSSGPVLSRAEGPVPSPAGPAQLRLDGSGDARQVDGASAAPLAPPVTVGYLRDGAGRGPAPTAGVGGFRGNTAAGGRFSAPNYGTNLPPSYPPVARDNGYEGTVYLRVLVRADGGVGKLAIDRSSGYEILDQAAVDSVKAWTFLPAQHGGKSVESWVLLPVKFALKSRGH